MKSVLKKYLPEFVYGSVDGIISTVAVITGSIGVGLSAKVILILALANVFADGFSMGSSNFLSSISYDQITKTESIYTNPNKKGFATFLSFVIIGIIPVIPFAFTIVMPSLAKTDIIISLLLSFLSFVFVGYIGARATQTSRSKNIIRTVIIGGIAAFISFIIGYLLNNFISDVDRII